ncbi:MAG: thiamine biosynthesis lipoprotein [Oceanospirillaceae bacterium]|jgi:thiamine biosynthesis lipoprotein
MFKSLSGALMRTSQRLAVILLAVFVVIFPSVSAQASDVVQAIEGGTMGTRYHVKWIAKDSETPGQVQQVKKQVDELLIVINQAMSTYIKDSELSLFNQKPQGHEQQVSAPLYELLVKAKQISESSEGAYDVTVGPLINLWGFGPDKRVIKAPSDAQIESVRQRVGYQYLELLGDNRIKKTEDLYIDLSSIAKGYGVDQVAKLIKDLGYSAYLVEIGGELITKGSKPNNEPWRIAVESPTAGRVIQRIVTVNDVAVATSGDYRIYFEEDGVRYSHIIDTKTGRPIAHNLASVTVLADNCAQADALATAFLAMGLEKSFQYATDNAIEAFFITKSKSGFVETMTPGFAKRIVK